MSHTPLQHKNANASEKVEKLIANIKENRNFYVENKKKIYEKSQCFSKHCEKTKIFDTISIEDDIQQLESFAFKTNIEHHVEHIYPNMMQTHKRKNGKFYLFLKGDKFHKLECTYKKKLLKFKVLRIKIVPEITDKILHYRFHFQVKCCISIYNDSCKIKIGSAKHVVATNNPFLKELKIRDFCPKEQIIITNENELIRLLHFLKNYTTHINPLPKAKQRKKRHIFLEHLWEKQEQQCVGYDRVMITKTLFTKKRVFYVKNSQKIFDIFSKTNIMGKIYFL